jgi:hypothetical protein
LNSITACDLLIASACASASRALEALCQNDMESSSALKELARRDPPTLHHPLRAANALILWKGFIKRLIFH